jgi:hypothetical protein
MLDTRAVAPVALVPAAMVCQRGQRGCEQGACGERVERFDARHDDLLSFLRDTVDFRVKD